MWFTTFCLKLVGCVFQYVIPKSSFYFYAFTVQSVSDFFAYVICTMEFPQGILNIYDIQYRVFLFIYFLFFIYKPRVYRVYLQGFKKYAKEHSADYSIRSNKLMGTLLHTRHSTADIYHTRVKR